jgi:hypothetical protein
MREGDIEPGYFAASGGDQVTVQVIFDIMAESHEFIWFAHNSQYELRYFIAGLLEHKENVSFYSRTDSDVFMINIRLPDYGDKAVLSIRDSMAIWPSSLEKLANTFCPELPKLFIDFEKLTFDPKNSDHIAYSKRDSETLLLSMIRFDAMIYDIFDVHLRVTTASTALAAWQRTLDSDDKYYNTPVHEDYIRSAYYGGLVFLTDTKKYDGCKTYDKNSSYPHQMLTYPMPIGSPLQTDLFDGRRPGIYTVTVRAPDDLIVPILPVRKRDGIVWPSGTFKTTVTSDELRFAVNHGYRLLTIHDGRVWNETCKPFDDFINKCMEIRLGNPGTALDQVAKLMQNSLYGKFGTRRKRRKIYATMTDEEITAGDTQAWGNFFIREETAEDMQCLPVWAVFITAHARLALLDKIYEIGPENVLYGDTDSITLKPGYSMEESKAYGGWKLEKTWQEFRAHAPKVYAGLLLDKTTKQRKLAGAAKGIPRRQWVKSGIFGAILDMLPQARVQYKTLEKFVSALKSGYIGQHESVRSMSDLSNSHSWRKRSDGTVRPRDWREHEQDEIATTRRSADRGKRDSIAKRAAS